MSWKEACRHCAKIDGSFHKQGKPNIGLIILQSIVLDAQNGTPYFGNLPARLRWSRDLSESIVASGPLGTKGPNNRASGPKYCNINGIWPLKPYYLGLWNRRGMQEHQQFKVSCFCWCWVGLVGVCMAVFNQK